MLSHFRISTFKRNESLSKRSIFSLLRIFKIGFPFRTSRLNGFLRLFLNKYDTIRRRPFLEVINGFKIVLNNEIPSLSGNKCIERVLTFCSTNLHYAHTNV